jgi:hypothetical protein
MVEVEVGESRGGFVLLVSFPFGPFFGDSVGGGRKKASSTMSRECR